MRRLICAAMVSATVLMSPAVSAIGLGDIQVDSSLNQPFSARIPLFAVASDELDSVRVNLADSADFERMGIERADYLSALRFRVEPGAPPRIQIEASRAVREPLLTLLLDVRSVTGRVLREYTVLLDPPAPIIAAAPPVAAQTSPPSPPATAIPTAVPTATPPVRSAPAPVMRLPGGASEAAPVTPAVAAAATPTATAVPATAAVAATTPTRSPSSFYGPVTAQETLWGVATAVRPSAQVTMNQVIYALVTTNPGAFDRGRFEGLMRGARLAVPSEAEMLATSPEAAQAAVAQWRRSGSIVGARATTVPAASPAAALSPSPFAPTAPRPSPTPAPTVSPTLVPPPADSRAARQDEEDAVAVAVSAEAEGSGPDGLARADTLDAVEMADDPVEAVVGLDLDRLPDGEIGFVEDGFDDDSAFDEAATPDVETEPAATPADREPSGLPLWLLGLLVLLGVLVVALLVSRRRRAASVASASAVAASPAVVTAAGLDRSAAAARPGSLEEAQRQADEAEALFMAAYTEDAAEAESTPAATTDDDPDATLVPGLNDAVSLSSAAAATSALALDSADDSTEPEFQNPLDEAEIHLAYGLHDEALSMLDKALVEQPTRGEWLAKRAEVLLAAGRIDAFKEAVHAADPYLDSAQREALAALQHDLGEVGQAGDLPPFPEQGDRVEDFDFEQPDAGRPVGSPGLRELPDPFADVAPTAELSPATPKEDAPLEFSLEPLPPVPAAPPADAAVSAADDDGHRLEFDLDIDGLDTPAAGDPPASAAAEADDDAGFELDLEGFDIGDAKAAPSAPVTSAEPGLDDPDFENLSLEEFSLDGLGEATVESESEVLSAGDGASTKLDLARAYVDMGDAEMGRALLGEVLAEGTPEQQAEARALLSRIG